MQTGIRKIVPIKHMYILNICIMDSIIIIKMIGSKFKQ